MSKDPISQAYKTRTQSHFILTLNPKPLEPNPVLSWKMPWCLLQGSWGIVNIVVAGIIALVLVPKMPLWPFPQMSSRVTVQLEMVTLFHEPPGSTHHSESGNGLRRASVGSNSQVDKSLHGTRACQQGWTL